MDMVKKLDLKYFDVIEENENEVYFKSMMTNRKWMLVEVKEDVKNGLERCYVLFFQLNNGEFVSVKEFKTIEGAIGRIKTIDRSILSKQAA